MWISSLAPSPTIEQPSSCCVSGRKMSFTKPSRSPMIWPRGFARKYARPHSKSMSCARELLLGQPDRRDLGDRVHAVRNHVRDGLLVAQIEGVAHRDARLLHRRRRERRKADDVAGGVDARHRACDTARRRRMKPRAFTCDADLLEPERRRRADAAGAVEHAVGARSRSRRRVTTARPFSTAMCATSVST